MDIGGWPLVNESSRKNRIAFKIWTAVPGVEKFTIGAAVQILETFPFILFHDSFTRGQPNMRLFIYESSATNIRDWSLAHSFIYQLLPYTNAHEVLVLSNEQIL